jgi:chromosome segregation ATPase
MPGKTQGDKIDELTTFAATLDERLNNARTELKQMTASQDKLAERLDDLRREVAVLQEQVKELKSGAQQSASRSFSLILALVAAALALLGQAILARFGIK